MQNNITVDFFAFTLDQFGLVEMQKLPKQTGGYVIFHELFDSPMFQESFAKIFETDEQNEMPIAFSGKVQVMMSPELKVNGAIGPCRSLKTGGKQVGDYTVGEGNTTSWYLGGLDGSTSIAFYFDLAQAQLPKGSSQAAYIQFLTTFKHSNGSHRFRVTTIQRPFVKANDFRDLGQGFD